MPRSSPIPFRAPAATGRHGSVLIVVLVVCLGLVGITLVFGQSMMMAYRGEDNDLAARQAQDAIEGAARYAQAVLANTNAVQTTQASQSLSSAQAAASATPGAIPDPSLYRNTAVPVGEATFWFIGQPQPSDPADQPVFGLVDEASKLNLNSGRVDANALSGLPGMTDDLAAAIVAWHTVPSGGTGTVTELNLDNSVKEAPFESVEELAQVNGGTDLSILCGNDANLNHCLDAEENGSGVVAGGTGQWSPGLLEYVTVFSREANILPDGTRRLNVNNPVNPNPVLKTVLGDARGAAIAGAFRSQGGPGSPPGGLRRYPSPLAFYSAAQASVGLTTDEFDKLSPKLTTTDKAFSTGLINVNTASATVLACVPGLANVAAQIVTARQGRTQPSTGLAWVAPIIGPAGIAQAGPWLTGSSYQFSVDVAAVGRHGRGYRRTRFVIDTSSGTPQIVYRRDLTFLGWALGSAVRENLTQIVESTTALGQRGGFTR